MNSATKTAPSPTPAPPPAPRARPRRPAWQWPLIGLASALALYLVGRGIAEPFVIHWGDPASYAADWGGPSLFGVLAVHCGPGLAVLGAAVWRLLPPDRPYYPSEG
jgi:hypothetical protein